MTMPARLCATLCAAVCLAGASSLANAAAYTLFDLGRFGPPPGPGEWSLMQATGFNNSGQVVGFETRLAQASDGSWTETGQTAWISGANGIMACGLAWLFWRRRTSLTR